MTILTDKQHTKIRAALALIHDSGGDALAVGQAAKRSIASGMSPKKAYEQALTAHVDANPAISNQILHTLKLIEASDGATVAAYGSALASYNDTGDRTALNGLAETFAKDSIALAVKSGELSVTDVRNRDAVEAALGFSFSEEVVAQSAPYAAAPQVSSPQPVPTVASATQHTGVSSGFAGKDAVPGASHSSGFQGDRRYAPAQAAPVNTPAQRPGTFQPIIRQAVEPGHGPVVVKGYTPSDTYG